MPISEFFDSYKFDPSTKRVMGVAYEMACAALKFENQTYVAHETIAKRIIALAKEGVVNPDRLCEQALNDLRNLSRVPSQLAALKFENQTYVAHEQSPSEL